MRDGCLEGIETIVERQQRVPAESHDDCLVLNRQHRGLRLFRACRKIGHEAALFPFCNGLGIDPVTPRKAPQALLTMLYRSTDRLRRCGAAVKNLAHSASFHCMENNAPSKPGIKQLVRTQNRFPLLAGHALIGALAQNLEACPH